MKKDSKQNKARPLATNFLSFCLIVAVATIAYANTFDSPFVFDDFHNITSNPYVKIKSLSFDNFHKAATESVSAYRWLPNISFALNYYFNGHEVWGYHLVNLLIHILTAIVLYYLTVTTLRLPLFNKVKHTREIALAAALLWAAHPVQTNAVTYIVQRMTAMAALFYLCAMLCYVKARLQQGTVNKYLFYAATLLSGLAAVFSKENAAMLPVTIMAYEFFFLRQPGEKYNYRKITALAVFAGIMFIVIGLMYLSKEPLTAMLSAYEYRDFTMTERLLTEPRVIFHYLSLLALPLPSRLNLAYDYQISTGLLSPPQTMLAIAGIAILFLLVPFLFRRQRLLSFAILFFLANLAIESTIFPLEIIFEHRLYLPSVFLFVTAAVFLYRLCQSRITSARFAVLIATGLLTLFTWQRNTVWADGVSLWTDVVNKSPNLARGHVNLGRVLWELERNNEAEKLFLKGIDLKPEHGMAYLNLGALYLKTNKPDQALEYLNLARNKKGVDTLFVRENISSAYFKIGDLDKAISEARQILELNPKSSKAYTTLGSAYGKRSQYRDAEKFFLKAIDLDHENGTAVLNLAAIYEKDERLHDALAILNKALTNEKVDKAKAYNMMGIVKWRLRDFKGSITAAQKAINIDPDLVDAHITLGITYEDMGLYQDASTQFKKAWNKGHDMVGLYNDWAKVMLTKGMTERAIMYLRQALELNYSHPESHDNLALAYETKGLIDEAHAEKNLALQLQGLAQ